jgi:hypothetical protein
LSFVLILIIVNAQYDTGCILINYFKKIFSFIYYFFDQGGNYCLTCSNGSCSLCSTLSNFLHTVNADVNGLDIACYITGQLGSYCESLCLSNSGCTGYNYF